ncbi:Membrane protein complex subunit 2-B [Oopsacas minuta]|uniref:ER membrane protein complex subunit 2 n=1 Tax=Oopsacas minuta TaxID=111878 RepID=A0AAV7K6D5_9METZ|nr:Membrane protein complex subunit 2-B [Oopsacas minuta]
MSKELLSSDWRLVYEELQVEQKKLRKNYSTILLLANHLVTHNSRALGQNVWEVYESIVLASLDCSDYEITTSALSKLSARFPKSTRVLVLKGILLEAKGHSDEVLELYQEIKRNEPLNRECRKRKITVHKSKGQNKMAIQELCEYLSLFIGDTEAWLELCDLYIIELDLYNAGFCIEELILSNPLSYLNHLKYAEICYTKGEEYWDSAAKHYTKVLTLKPDSIRALFGVILTFYAIMKMSRQNLQSKEKRMVDWAKCKLKVLYRNSGNETGCRMLENTIQYFDK